MHKPRLVSVRNAFISGLLLLAPLAVTWLVFSWLVARVGGAFRPIFFFPLPAELRNDEALEIVWNVLATLIVLLMITGLGYLSRYVLGKYFVRQAERIIQGIPGAGGLYNTVKQVVSTFSLPNRNLFSKAVMIEFPRKSVYVVGFLTSKEQGEPQTKTGAGEIWTIFVPTTPNPTSGYLALVPSGDVVELNMSVGDAMKLVISGGSVIPPWPNGAKAPVRIQNPTLSASLAPESGHEAG